MKVDVSNELEKHDFNTEEDSSHRKLNLFWTRILTILGTLLTLFHLYTAYRGIVVLQTSIHLLFALALCFMIYPMYKNQRNGKLGLPLIDILFVFLSIVVNVYYIIHFERIIYELAYLRPTPLDVVFGVITLILIFEGARRAIGIVFPCVGLAALLYVMFGNHLSGIFQHPGFTMKAIVSNLYIGQLGILQGSLLGVSAKTVAIFIIFGAVLVVSGGGNMFIKLAVAIAGRLTGGPGKVATLASGLFGLVSGSTAANVATTGVFTIPLMKKNGYKNDFTGGVEAAGSCGGQILPPIMGAAAFVLAEVTQISYAVVAASAIIPALLFYFGVWMSVHFEAKRLNLKPIESKDIPNLREVVLSFDALTLFVPLIVLTLFLIFGYTPTLSAFWATIAAIVLFLIQSYIKKNINAAFGKMIEACVQGAKTVVMIAVILAVAQVVATVIGMTGIGNKFTSMINLIGDGSLIITLIIGMIVTIIMGMGVPTIAAYMLSAAVIAPAFYSLDLPILATHMFVLYYAILSAVTPPVALAGFIAAGIAKGHWFKTSMEGCKIGLAGFLIPFMFIYNQAYLGEGTLIEIAMAIITGILGVLVLSASTIGYFLVRVSIILRLILLISAIAFLTNSFLSNIIGFSLFLIVLLLQIRQRNNNKADALPS